MLLDRHTGDRLDAQIQREYGFPVDWDAFIAREPDRADELRAMRDLGAGSWMTTLLDVADAADPLTVDLVREIQSRVDRNPAMLILSALEFAGRLDVNVLRSLLPRTWAGAEFPTQWVAAEDWKDMWERIGYTVDGKVTPPPADDVRLCRAAPETTLWTGLSWSDDPQKAAVFLTSHGRSTLDPQLWSTLIPSDRILAQVNLRGEREFIVDTDGDGPWKDRVTSIPFSIPDECPAVLTVADV